MKRFVRLAVILGLCASSAACIGRFRATSAVFEWNKSVSSSKFVREVVFLGLCIVPVYELTVALIDPFVLNVIDFWSGGQVAQAHDLSDGSRLALASLGPDTLRITHSRAGVVLSSVAVERVAPGAAQLRDQQGRIMAAVEQLPDGQVVTR